MSTSHHKSQSKNTGMSFDKTCFQCGQNAPLPALNTEPPIYVDEKTGDIYYYDFDDPTPQWKKKECSFTDYKPVVVKFIDVINQDSFTLDHEFSEIYNAEIEVVLNGSELFESYGLPMSYTVNDPGGNSNAQIILNKPVGELNRPCWLKIKYFITETQTC